MFAIQHFKKTRRTNPAVCSSSHEGKKQNKIKPPTGQQRAPTLFLRDNVDLPFDCLPLLCAWWAASVQTRYRPGVRGAPSAGGCGGTNPRDGTPMGAARGGCLVPSPECGDLPGLAHVREQTHGSAPKACGLQQQSDFLFFFFGVNLALPVLQIRKHIKY